jgi:hypothetical protein
MALALGYAIAAVVAVYLLDYSFYGRMMNIISIARLSSGREAPDAPYKPNTVSRMVCSVMVALATFAAAVTLGMLQTICVVAAIVAAAVMVLITVGNRM